MAQKTRRESIPLAGYAFDGLNLLLAVADSKDRIVDQFMGRQQLELEPSLIAWYTKRRVENAVARGQANGSLPKGMDMNRIGYTAAFVELLKADPKAKPRLTVDFIEHLITAGRAFTDDELLEARVKAELFVARLQDAFQPAVQPAAVA